MTKTGVQPLFYDQPDDKPTIDEIYQSLGQADPLQSLLRITSAFFDECRYFMDDKQFLQKVKDMQFDMMIIDGYPLAACRYILPYHLDVPYVYQFSTSAEWMLNIPSLPSFNPSMDITSNISLSDKMNFGQRTVNFLLYLLSYFLIPFPFTVDTSLLDEYAPGLTWDDLALKSELFLVTRDHMLEYPTIQLPNLITTPGISVQPAKPLSEHLEKIFQEAEHGVVVVSFGSVTRGLNNVTIETLFRVFSKLKQTVVMRFPDDIEAAKKKASSNLHLVSWLPQNDMLGHNKTVAFVTHCGNNGRYEAVYHGVPMVGVPVFGDQLHNAFRVVDHGYGVQVQSMDKMTEADLHEALTEVIENPKYHKNVKHASGIIKSQKMLPKETLAYWVDHVMKFGGAHLRPASQDLSLYQIFMLDVIAFLTVMTAVSVYTTSLMFKKCCRGKTKSKED